MTKEIITYGSDNLTDPEIQKRDWKSYNDQLVKRGELLIDLDFVENWEKELEEMNQSKRGRPFAHPESLVEFLTFPRFFFRLPFRQGEGINADGPIPPDSLFSKARGGWYDVGVAMYHDQGHVPMKVVGFE